MQNVFGIRAFAAVVFCLSILGLINVNSAQDLDNVSISGKITDSNNAPIVGAAVTAKLTTTGVERNVVTNEDGVYRIVELKPGNYSIKVSANGFSTKEQTNLNTIAGQNVQLNISLSPGSIKAEQTITINDNDEPVIDTTRTVVGSTVTGREIEELPVNSRNALDLVLTLGGTSEESLSTRDLAEDRNADNRLPPTEQGNFSLSGGASYSNNITIDGLDNNDDRSAQDRFQPPIDSIAEVQVITNQFSAEYGRASGGRINLRTRAGTNKFRGRAFMFFRDDKLNANTWYNNSRGIPRLPLTEYDPGFTFSGPVILPFGEGKSLYNGKNRTFFSVSYEYDRLKDTTLIDTYVPVVSNPRFALPVSTGGTQTCDNASFTACTTNPPTAGFVAPYTFTIPTPSVTQTFVARIDHRVSKNNDLTFGFQLGKKDNQRNNVASVTRIADALQERKSSTDAYNLTDNHVFGANTVNQFRVQWSRFKPTFETDNPFDPVVLISYRNPVTGSVQTLIAGNSTSSLSASAIYADKRKETRWQFQDSLTYIWRNHTIKAGFDVQKVNSETIALDDATGTFNFTSVLNYQNNILSRFRQNFGTSSDIKNTYLGVFLNDEAKLSNLTLSFGLRYEKETVLNDNNNFGPRLGIAYSPWKSGKGVIRFGAGIFYNRTLLRTVGDFIVNTSGNLFTFDSNNIGTGATDTRRVAILAKIAQQFPNGFSSVTDLKNLITSTGNVTNVGFTANSLIRSTDPNLKIPESYQFNIGFEREIGKGFVFEANYTFNKTVHLWREYNPNAPVLPAGYADWTAYLLANPYKFTNTNGNIRTYTFYLGSNGDGGAPVSNLTTGASCSTTATVNCFVNLNSLNTGTDAPATATADSSNLIGNPLGIALAAVSKFRPDQSVQQKERVASIGNSLYQGLILEIRSRYRKLGYGFSASFRGVYTLSSTKDDGINNTTDAEINGNFSREWARNLQDRRHRFAFSGTFAAPRWFGKLRLSPIFRYGSSAPFNLGNGGSDRNLDDIANDRLNFSGNVKDIVWREPNSPFPNALVAQFSLPPIGAKSGNLPRNAGAGPQFYTFDLNITREFKFTERLKLRPSIEFDNILNAAVFSYGSSFIDFAGLRTTPAPTAAQLAAYQNILIPNRTYRQRQIRLGMRFDF